MELLTVEAVVMVVKVAVVTLFTKVGVHNAIATSTYLDTV